MGLTSDASRSIVGTVDRRARLSVRHVVGVSEGQRVQQQGDSSWRYPAFTINPDWTAFSVSKIPSITFFLPPNNASGPPACRLLKGGS